MNDSSDNNLMRAPTIAIIDDDKNLTNAIARILRANYNCVVNGFGSVEEFLIAVDKHPNINNPNDMADLILLDFHLPGQNGPYLVNELKRRSSPLLTKSRIIGITADNEPVVYAGFKDVGIDEIFLKPLKQIDFGTIADRAYRVCRDLDSKIPGPFFKRTI